MPSFNLPDGCTRLPCDDYDDRCEICGADTSACQCPPCPECGEVGDPNCLLSHSLDVPDMHPFCVEWVREQQSAAQKVAHSLRECMLEDVDACMLEQASDTIERCAELLRDHPAEPDPAECDPDESFTIGSIDRMGTCGCDCGGDATAEVYESGGRYWVRVYWDSSSDCGATELGACPPGTTLAEARMMACNGLDAFFDQGFGTTEDMYHWIDTGEHRPVYQIADGDSVELEISEEWESDGMARLMFYHQGGGVYASELFHVGTDAYSMDAWGDVYEYCHRMGWTRS